MPKSSKRVVKASTVMAKAKPKRSKQPKPRMSKTKPTPVDPNRESFDRGRPYVELQLKKAGLDPNAQVFTSHDPRAKAALALLKTQHSPAGFEKWQLPFSFLYPTNLYVGTAAPGAEVAPHAHDSGAGMRFILEGSVTINGELLEPGDWAYIPRGKSYSLKAGPVGARMISEYAC